MKIGLIVPGNIWFSPYVTIYTDVLDKLQIEYEVVSWNRDGSDKPYGIQYTNNNQSQGKFHKLLSYLKYISFLKKTIKEQKYEKLIVFSPQLSILLYGFLKKFKQNYIIDYRDLSIEQKPYLMPFFDTILSNSYANVISSPGFKEYLPKSHHYILSHNFNINIVKEYIDKPLNNSEWNKAPYRILTIGGIRDYQSNIEVVKSLANKDGYEISFVGKGFAAPLIEKYVRDNSIENATFEGYYPKEKEGEYIKSSTFLNIFYPKIKSHSSALSNRFYNALIYRKPMIVTSDSTQGDYVDKYNLGLAIDNCNDLDKKIQEWLSCNDRLDFSNRSIKLLSTFVEDYNTFVNTIKHFVDK